MSDDRIQSFEEFWPFYLSEHRNPNSRRLHFVGTTGWAATVVASAVSNPVGFGTAMAGFAAVLRDGFKKENGKFPVGHLLTMVALPTAASPILFPAGVTFAYACAWAGHFGLEKNKPASFKYPIWSFCADWKMWSLMARGKLWSGDPLEEMGLEMPEAEEPREAFHGAAIPA